MIKPNRSIINSLLFFAINISLVFFFTGSDVFIHAVAQSEEDPWSPPINLSHSGSTTNPMIVVDSNRTKHVIWEDEYLGWIYTSSNGNEWDFPVAVDFPFGSSNLILIPDQQNLIHAFWTDVENALYYSHVIATDFVNPSAWLATIILAQSALDTDVDVDSQGNIHLSYVRSLDEGGFPAGIYYRISQDQGLNWSSPQIIYQSQYMRGIDEKLSNVDLALSKRDEINNIYIVWDNPLRKRVLFAQSTTLGESWTEPLEIDSPNIETGYARPFNIRIGAQNDNILIIWQIGDPATNCSQVSQWSSDNGTTWNIKSEMLEETPGCAQDNTLYMLNDGLLLLQTTIQDQISLLAWDGNRWSEEQLQQSVSGFIDPETYDQVLFSCQQSTVVGNDQLVIVGCDEGEGGDTWFSERALGGIQEWFPPPPPWSPIKSITTSQSKIMSPNVVSDTLGQLHAIWSQIEIDTSNEDRSLIYYSRWDGTRWTRPSAVLQSPQGEASNPTMEINVNNKLLVVWEETQLGEVLFSWADADRANSALEWVEPLALPLPREAGKMPDLVVNGETIYVIYAIPLNEQRGIYLTRSEDSGDRWMEPVQIFNGADEGWEMVGEPDLATTSDGNLHAIWTSYSLPGGVGPLNLFYAQSVDDGVSWSNAELVVENRITWSQIAAQGEYVVHRMWTEEVDEQQLFQHQVSSDGGITWSQLVGISTTDNPLSDIVLTEDIGGSLHLLQIILSSTGKPELMHWTWDSERWSINDSLELNQTYDYDGGYMGAAVSPEGRLGVIFTGNNFNEVDDAANQELFFTDNQVDIVNEMTALISPTVEIGLATESNISTLPTTTSTPEPTQTPVIPAEPPQASRSGILPLSNSWSGVIIAGVLASVIVIIVFCFYWFILRPGIKNKAQD